MITIKCPRADWKIKRLQFGATILNSSVDKKIVEGEIPVRLCNYVDVYYNDIITEHLEFMEGSATKEEIDKFKLIEGDVIITKDSESPDDIGIPAYVEKDMEGVVCGYHLAIFKPFKEKINGKFLLYYLNSKIAQATFEISSNGVTRFGLPRNAIKTLPVPYPSITEQIQIATYLDNKTSHLDSLIKQKERLLNLLNEKRTSLITQAVTKGINPDVKMKDSGIEWIGKIPKHWELKTLKRFARICNGQDHKGVWSAEGKYPIIGSGGVFGKATQYLHKGPSVLLGRKGTIDKPQFVDEPFWSVDTAYFTDIYSNTDVRFFYYLTLTIKFDLYRYGSAVPSMTQQDLGQIVFATPKNIDEQKEIAKYLDASTSEIDELIGKIQESIKNLTEYREALITAAVTGQIDVRKKEAYE